MPATAGSLRDVRASTVELGQAARRHARVLVPRAEAVGDPIERLEPGRDGGVGVGDLAEVEPDRQ